MHNIRDRRLKENTDSKHHMEDVCKLIPDSLSDVDLENTRWHRGCYQHFTMNLNCFQSDSQALLEDAQPPPPPPPTPTKKKKKKHPEEGNLFSHMGSVYSVTRRQQHLEGKCSSQLRDLQAGVKKKIWMDQY